MQVAAVSQPWEAELTGRDIAGVAIEAERLGFEKVFVPEHFLTPTAHLALSGSHYLHGSTAQGFIAGATSKITVGTMLTILPLHDPVILAKSLATLDWLSGGRAQVTFGVGWLEAEFDAIRVPFHERGRVSDESLEAMFALWHDEAPSYAGKYVTFDDVAFGPKPVSRPHPAIWFGGDSDAAIRRAARFGDGWAPWLTPIADLPAKLDQLKGSAGYDGRPFDLFFSLAATGIGEEHAVVEGAESSSFNLDQTVEQCGTLAAAGVTETWIAPPPVSGLAEYLDHLRWVAEEVQPLVAKL
jgi:probable F420-dependent oxidoreductase